MSVELDDEIDRMMDSARDTNDFDSVEGQMKRFMRAIKLAVSETVASDRVNGWSQIVALRAENAQLKRELAEQRKLNDILQQFAAESGS